MRPRLALVAGWLALGGAAGCLPEAGPGLGEHWVKARGIIGLDAPWPLAPGRVFFGQAGVPPAGLPETERNRTFLDLMVTDGFWRTSQPVLRDYDPDEPLRFDARGRLYVPARFRQIYGACRTASNVYLVVDLLTGFQFDLGAANSPLMSPGGQQLVYSADCDSTIVRSSDDVVHTIPAQLRQHLFVNEALYAQGGDRLWRVLPGEQPQYLAERVHGFHQVSRPDLGFLQSFVTHYRDGCRPRRAQLLFQGPGDGFLSEDLGIVDSQRPMWVSPDGNRVVLVEPRSTSMESPVRVITLVPRSEVRFVVPTLMRAGSRGDLGGPAENPTSCTGDLPSPLEVQFRPNTQEVWVGAPGVLAVLHADGRMEVWHGEFNSFAPLPQLAGQSRVFFSDTVRQVSFDSAFSLDGNFFAYFGPRSERRLGSVAYGMLRPVTDVGPSNRLRGLGQLAPTGLLVSWTEDSDSFSRGRIDLHLHDGTTGAKQATVRDVRQVVFGHYRLLAITRSTTREAFAPGSLDLLGLSGELLQHVAGNVTEVLPLPAVHELDPTASGSPFAYVVHARVPWKHDGLWVAALP